jgi:hypothetical protein
MPLILGANTLTAGGYEVDNSLRFNSGSSDYLAKTPSSTTDQQVFTFSTWFKFSDVSATYNNIASFGASSVTNGVCYIDINSSKQLEIFMRASGTEYKSITSQLFRDVSAWYHIVIAVDTTQATSTNRTKVYVNGSQVSAFSTQNAVPQNTNLLVNTSGSENRIGASRDSGSSLGSYFNGYQTEINLIDGQQIDETSFGEFDEDSGIWKPIAYTGTYGTNGFYLEFKDSSALGDDTSGNSNDFTVNNLTSIDQTTDTPTNNFATSNPLEKEPPSYSEGNLAYTCGAVWRNAPSTIAVNTGKWYAEFKVGGVNTIAGIASVTDLATNTILLMGQTANSIGYDSSGTRGINNSFVAYGNSFTTNDIISIAMDLDNNKLYFAKNGTYQNSGVPTSGATGTGAISIATSDFYVMGMSVNNNAGYSNFGNAPYTISSGNSDANGYGNFEYAVPSGYFALNTKNLAEYG